MSNLRKGGGIQVALSLIDVYSKEYKNINFIFLCSTSIYNRLSPDIFKVSNIEIFEFNVVLSNPFSVIIGLYRFKKIEKKYSATSFFTIFGPTIYRPNCKHLVGFAQGHLVDKESPYWSIASKYEIYSIKFKKLFFKFLFRYTSDIYHVESEITRIQLSHYLNIDKRKIICANNYPHVIFDDFNFKTSHEKFRDNKFVFAVVCAYYSHKNLLVINKIVQYINSEKIKLNIKFILTIDSALFDKEFIKSDMIYNVGPVSGNNLINLYKNSDALFLPTLLEIFPGNYLECMKLGIPIMTSNLNFAKSICNDAACYFDPLNHIQITNVIKYFIDNHEYRNTLISNGFNNLKLYMNSKERADLLINSIVKYDKF